MNIKFINSILKIFGLSHYCILWKIRGNSSLISCLTVKFTFLTSNISRFITSFCYIMRYCEPNPHVTTNNTPYILAHTNRKRWKLERTSSMSLRVCSPHRCAAYDGQALRIATTGALYWSRVGGQPGVECLLHSSWSVNWDKQYKIHLPSPPPRSPISCSTLEYQKRGLHIPHKPALKCQYSNLHSALPFIASLHTITWYSRLPPSKAININMLWQHECGPWLAKSNMYS